MAHTEWCGLHECSECKNYCKFDYNSPCSASCDGLVGNYLDVVHCVKHCDIENLFHIFLWGTDGFEDYDENLDEVYKKILLEEYANEDGLAYFPY